MEKNKMSAITMIAIILGAVGMGFGVYSVFVLQTGGADGDDGDDGDDGATGLKGDKGDEAFYYCSSQSEIEAALDTIGTGQGTIIITENITLSSQINIDDGGDYIIQGDGLITIERNENDQIFYITNAKSLILKNLIIDASAISENNMEAIYINEINDNPVYIKNIHINGPSNNGEGVEVRSNNTKIENCIITDFNIGIYIYGDCAYCQIVDNLISNIYDDIWACAIHLRNTYKHMVTGNNIIGVNGTVASAGIFLENTDYIIINNNYVWHIDGTLTASGIYLDGPSDYNTVVGNIVGECAIDPIHITTVGTNTEGNNIEV